MATQRRRLRDPVFPWRDNVDCCLAVGPDTHLEHLRKAIDAARYYVLLEMYLLEPGKELDLLFDSLVEVAQRGVHVWLLTDSFGSRQLSTADFARIASPGIQVAAYHPFSWLQLRYYLFRDHRKLLLVDGEVAYTGGVGVSDGLAVGQALPLPWYDSLVRCTGQVVADWQTLFARQWQRVTGNLPTLPECPRHTAPGKIARVSSSQPGLPNAVNTHLRMHITVASKRVWIATAYFLPRWRLRRVLRQARERGADVRLLLPGPLTDNLPVRYASQHYYQRLLKSGIRIFEYAPTFMHAKVALVDDWVSIGSSNFDSWSYSRNLEANLEVIDTNFANEVADWFENSLGQAREVNPDSWQHRPRWKKWREQLLGLIEQEVNRR